MEEKQERRNTKDELRQIAPGLSDLKLEDGFAVPHNYFKELPDKVIGRINTESQRPGLLQEWWTRLRQPRYVIALASVLILIVAGIWFSQPGTEHDPLADITQDEALEYIMANLHEYSAEDVIAMSGDAAWDADALIRVSDENIDEMLDEILESGDEMYIEDLF